MTQLAWIGLLEAEGGQLGEAQAWRDGTLLPRVQALPGLRQTHLYAAFNAAQLALVAQVSEPLHAGAAIAPDAPAGMALRQQLAELTYEKLQSGSHAGEDEALLYSVRFAVPREWTEEFDSWYEQEHIPMIYGCPHWSMTRRYRFLEGGPGAPTHLALHYLSDARGFDAPQLRAARLTPWRRKFLGQRWFTQVDKMIYFRQQAAHAV
jgi:hypothetical protein